MDPDMKEKDNIAAATCQSEHRCCYFKLNDDDRTNLSLDDKKNQQYSGLEDLVVIIKMKYLRHYLQLTLKGE